MVRVVFFLLTACVWPCGAVGLGEATLLSGLEQPLRVEIELTSEIRPGMQVRLASEQAFRESGVNYPAWLSKAQVDLLHAQGSRRRAALLLQAPQAGQTQLIELVLEFSWPTGSFQQPYVLLLDESSRFRPPAAPVIIPTSVVVAEVAESPATVSPQPEILEPIVESVRAAPTAKTKEIPGARPEAMRPPVKQREYAGSISTRRFTPAAGLVQDRLRLAKARSEQVDRIAQQRHEANQQARMQELELNAQQIRELANQVAVVAPPAPLPQIPVSAAVHAPASPVPVSKAGHLSPHKPLNPGQHASIWPWVLPGLTVPLLIVWALRFWFVQHRSKFTDSASAAGSVFELSPAEAERAYSDYMQQRQASARADAAQVEEARALFTLGHFADAQQLLDPLLRQNPRSHEAWFLLARVLCAQGDRADFAQRMPQLRELTGETGELWDRVLVLGRELDPGNPLYRSTMLSTETQPHAAVQAEPLAIHKPLTPTAANTVDDALRMATAYGAHPV